MSVSFFLASPSQPKSSIYAFVRFQRKPYKKAIGVSVDTRYWNPERQVASVNQKYRDGAVINSKLKIWENAIERVMFNCEKNSIKITDSRHFWELVRCDIDGVPYQVINEKQDYFSDYFTKTFIPKFQGKKSESRITRFSVIANLIKSYEKDRGRRLRFDDFDMCMYRDLLDWAREKKYAPNYMGSVVKIVKQVMAEARGFDKLHNNEEVERFKAPNQDVDTIYLTVPELRMIHNFCIDDDFVMKIYPNASPRNTEHIKLSFNIAKNKFLIGAFTGLRVSDFNSLREHNLQGDRIVIVQKKKNYPLTIPVHPIIAEIFDSGFDLNLSLSEQKIRNYIKIIAREVGINGVMEVRDSSFEAEVHQYKKWQLIGTHTARRSFATNTYLSKSVPTAIIMRITGHKKESDFMKYIRVTNEESANILADSSFFKES